MRPSLLLLLTPFAFGCAVDTTEPPAVPLQPQLSVAAAPTDLPNVIRFRDVFVFGIIDPNTDLWAFAGLPDNPKQATECGGPDGSYAVVDIQNVGVRKEVLKVIAKGDQVNLDVYRLSTFVDICTSTPIAHGKGSISYHDNDFFETGGGNNTFGWWMGGPVTLATGGTANLLAHNLWQLLPNGTFRRVFRQVKLSGSPA